MVRAKGRVVSGCASVKLRPALQNPPRVSGRLAKAGLLVEKMKAVSAVTRAHRRPCGSRRPAPPETRRSTATPTCAVRRVEGRGKISATSRPREHCTAMAPCPTAGTHLAAKGSSGRKSSARPVRDAEALEPGRREHRAICQMLLFADLLSAACPRCHANLVRNLTPGNSAAICSRRRRLPVAIVCRAHSAPCAQHDAHRAQVLARQIAGDRQLGRHVAGQIFQVLCTAHISLAAHGSALLRVRCR